jgi:hypothetical protein
MITGYTDRPIDTHPTILLLLHVFVAAGTCLPSNNKRDTHYGLTDCREGFMKYAVEMGLGAMIYIPSFIKIGSGIRKLMVGEGFTDTQHGDCISLL